MTPGERLKAVRGKYELTVSDVAVKCNVKEDIVAAIEAGSVKYWDLDIPEHARLIKGLCRFYNIDFIWMLDGIGKMTFEYCNPALGLAENILDVGSGICEDARTILTVKFYNILQALSDEELGRAETLLNLLEHQGEISPGVIARIMFRPSPLLSIANTNV